MVGTVPPELHTSVPLTAVIAPGVPLEFVPLRTSPSTSKDVYPFSRFTRARPLCTVQGPAPAWIVPTGLSTPGALMTPTILFQLTVGFSFSKPNAVAALRAIGSNATKIFFIYLILFTEHRLGRGLTGYVGKIRQSIHCAGDGTVSFRSCFRS